MTAARSVGPTVSSARASDWLPADSPSNASIALQAAGVHWDAIKAPLQIAAHTLQALGTDSGAVICDPWGQSVYWLVPVGTAAGWELPHTKPCGDTQYVGVPSAHRGPAGPHWLVPPADFQYLTDPAQLRDALKNAVAVVLEPRDGGPS